MDKRLSIALLLTAIIVAVTPILFPTPRRTPTTTNASSQHVADSIVPQRANQTASEIAPSRVGEVADSAPIAASPQAPHGKTITVDTKRASYEFSTLGAAPVSVS